MKLKKIEVSNFAKVKDISIELKPGVNVLAYPNGWGKSTTITAMLYALNFLNTRNGDVASKLTPEVDIKLTLENGKVAGKKYEKKKMNTTIDGVPVEIDDISKMMKYTDIDSYRILPESFLRGDLAAVKKKNLLIDLLRIDKEDLKAIFKDTGVEDFENPLDSAAAKRSYWKKQVDTKQVVVDKQEEKFKNINDEFGQKKDADEKIKELEKNIDKLVDEKALLVDKLYGARTPFVAARDRKEELGIKMKKINEEIKVVQEEATKLSTQLEMSKTAFEKNKKNIETIEENGCPTCGSKDGTSELKKKLGEENEIVLNFATGASAEFKIAKEQLRKKNEELETIEIEYDKIEKYLLRETDSISDAKTAVDNIQNELVALRAKLVTLKQDDSAAIIENLKNDLDKEKKELEKTKAELDIADEILKRVKSKLPKLQEVIKASWKNFLFPAFDLVIFKKKDDEFVEAFDLMFEDGGVMKSYNELSNANRKKAELEFSINTGAPIVIMDDLDAITDNHFASIIASLEEKCPDVQFILARAKDFPSAT